MDTNTHSRIDEQHANLILTPIMTTASTPATPGPSTPTTVRTLPLNELKVDDFEEEIIPPERPQSTPFPHQDLMEGDMHCASRTGETDVFLDVPLRPFEFQQGQFSTSLLCALPTEIHECILDHLFGVRASASSRTAAGKMKILRSWGTVLRHSRRREVSELALVSKQWRDLIQDRLYRHLKIKGTRESVELATDYFFQHPHLCGHVKHIEIWFPVFQQKTPSFDRTIRVPSITPDRVALVRFGNVAQDVGNTVTYQSPSNNCTLDEIFRFIQMTFAEACILTLEGGDRKKPPMVQQFRNSTTRFLPTITSVKTLVCKGQWNLIRSNDDFQNIAAALPNMIEWHGSYAKPKSKSYISMASILPKLPLHLTHLNLCLEADYRREAICPVFFKKVGQNVHFCMEMSKAIPTLEHLQYTGRICHCLFENGAKLSNPRTTRLKSVDLVVKNVCRPSYLWNDGSGVTDMAFILAFESLVLAAVKSLDRLKQLEFLRIRFIDLGGSDFASLCSFTDLCTDSQIPALNPYFQIEDRKVTGIWSDAIVENLARTKPSATFVEKSESLTDPSLKRDVTMLGFGTYQKTRPLSIKVANYASITSVGISIN